MRQPQHAQRHQRNRDRHDRAREHDGHDRTQLHGDAGRPLNQPDQSPPSAPQPDNSGRNAADRGTTAPTPLDQGENATDRRITADIRKAVMGESGMSTNGQNCKIITKDGVVTLRGPVDSQAEKDAIEAKARAVAGVTSVVNELEVKTK